MCGITGIIDSTPVSKQVLNKMVNAIKHRGPNGNDTYINENVGLGHVRLSIIDLQEDSNQPLFSNDKQLSIVFNGEIYNYKELRKQLNYPYQTNSDTEVILAAYLKWGEDCLFHFKGMFSFVIYDQTKNLIFAARDRFGIKPFYYFYNNSTFIFSSEIKGILASGKVKAELNDPIFYDFVVYNRTDHEAETCFRQIKNLRPGHKITLDLTSQNFCIKKWYYLPEIKNSGDINFEQTKQILTDKLLRSIDLHLISDVPVGVALSGGIDSSSITGMSKSRLPNNYELNSFSAVFDDNFEKNEKVYIDDVVKFNSLKPHFARPVVEDLIKNIDQIIHQQEEPFGSASIFANWSVYKKANEQKLKVLLNGQGADEVFAYDYMAAFYFYELYRKLKWFKLLREIYLFSKKQLEAKFTLKLFAFLVVPSFLKNKLIKISDPLINSDFFNKNSKKSNFHKEFFESKSLNENVKQHLLMKLHHLLREEDKNSMYFGVESRVPFLDDELVEFALNITSKFKVNNGEVKYILKAAMQPYLPKMIFERNNKIGYETPMAKWLNSDSFQKEIDNMIESTDQPMEKYLNLRYLKRIWKNHKSNKGDYSSEIWKYFYLTKWYNIYFK